MVSTLARASVDGAVLVAAVWLLAKVLRLAPGTRTVLWWCAAAKFIVSLAWTAPVAIPVLPAAPHAAVQVMERATGSVAADARRSTAASRGRRAAAPSPGVAASVAGGLREWSSFAAIGWTIGLAIAALLGLRRWRDTVAMLRASVPAAAAVQAQAAELAERMGLRRTPAVRISSRAETPLVTGLVRPVVVLPAGRVETLTDEQQRMAICHELAHVKRGDLWLGCVPALAERLFFFHPLVHVAAREYALAREAACDASVVRTLDAAPQDYGRLLLALGVAPSPGLSAAGAAWSFDHLKRRIAMLQDTQPRRARSGLVTAAVIGLAVIALVPLQLVARPATARPTPAGATAVRQDAARPEPLEAVEREDAPAQQAASRRPSSDDLRFVLFSEDGSRTTSGPHESGDVARAERQRRDGEAMLWFRHGGKEYVVRDAEVLKRARRLWNDSVYRPDFEIEGVRALTHALKAVDFEKLAAHGALVAQSLDGAMIADHARLAAEAGQRAAEIGLKAAHEALRGLADGGVLSPSDELKLEQHLKSLDKLDFDHHRHDIEKLTQELGKDLEHSLKSLDHLKGDLDLQMRDLHDQLRDLEPLRDMAEPMKEFGHRMGEFGHDIGEAVRKATDEMRALIERAIENGQARVVK